MIMRNDHCTWPSLFTTIISFFFNFLIWGNLYWNVNDVWSCHNCNLVFLHYILRGFMYFWLKFPRIVPFGQCLSLSQSPPTLPPSPLLLSPPPSPMLSSSRLPAAHFGRPPGSFSRPGVVQSRRLLQRWSSSWCNQSRWTGRAFPLPLPSHMPTPAVCILPQPWLSPVCELCQKLHQNDQRKHQEEKWCWASGWSTIISTIAIINHFPFSDKPM